MKFKTLYILLFCFCLHFTYAQQNTVFIGSYFKDQLFRPSFSEKNAFSNFLPITESEFDLNKAIADTSVQYYDAAVVLFQKHLIEINKKDYSIHISPIFNFALGKDFQDTLNKRLFQNSRGFFIEADITSKFSFSTAFVENQARFTRYQSNYYSSNGEFYPDLNDSSYNRQNAVVPGGGRTKPFKTDAFDYAFAVGNLIFKPFQFLQIQAGNNAQFVGSGHRSMLFSDNSFNAPYFKINWKLSSNWSYSYYRSKFQNLIRRPYHSTPEALYESKLFASNYLTWRPNHHFEISLFEGQMWSSGDSINRKKLNPLFFNPLPLVNEWVSKENDLYTVLGLDAKININDTWMVYSQLAWGAKSKDQFAFQVGTRLYDVFKIKNLLVQAEYNVATDNMYQSSNSRINYSMTNLPIAHPKGAGFQEVLFRVSYDWKRMYLDGSFVTSFASNYKENILSPINENPVSKKYRTYYQMIEIGYRFNKKMNFAVFINCLYRVTNIGFAPHTFAISGGIKTSIFNSYQDL
jgi:hypothetical protein